MNHVKASQQVPSDHVDSERSRTKGLPKFSLRTMVDVTWVAN